MWRLTFIGLLIFASPVVSADNAPKAGTYYTYGQLGIKKLEIKGKQIHLVFKPTDEQFHWCPGIKVQTTKKATIVTFVRCKTSQTCGIDRKADIGKKLIRTISIDIGNVDVYVRNGEKKFHRIHKVPKPKPKSATKTKNAGSNKRASVLLRPIENNDPKGRVKNYLIKPSN